MLLVDDNNINLRVLDRILKKIGFNNIEMVMDGQQALDRIEQKNRLLSSSLRHRCAIPYDIIFMDIQVPFFGCVKGGEGGVGGGRRV